FFDICNQKALTGDQGVIIPASNVKHLMLHDNVVKASEQGKFHIYPVSTVDEAIALLTGIKAGKLNKKGNYPKASINYRVQSRLEELAKLRHEFGESEKNTDNH
ncbi:MAG: ATP-dependent protease, partial [Gammaproteobacteria bacterium]|nr:ATP-dependent protease [Gammaproteobacteria bacterium]